MIKYDNHLFLKIGRIVKKQSSNDQYNNSKRWYFVIATSFLGIMLGLFTKL